MPLVADDPRIPVLFLCTGNSARSVLAEVLLNSLGGDRFIAFSAGSHPAGQVNPGAIAQLERMGHPTDNLRSKSWDEFAEPGAPAFRLVFTVCDNAAGEACPVWIGTPLTIHWGIPDPAAITAPPDAVALAFERAYQQMRRRIEGLIELPLAELPDDEIRSRLAALGADPDA